MNKKITKILSIIALMFIAIVISGCEMPGTNPGSVEKIKLDTPTNVVIDEETFEVTWDNVTDAIYYKVYVYKNNVCVETIQAESGVVLTELDAVEEGSYEVSIVAFGNSETHKNSAFSERVTFTLPEKPVDPEELNKPKLPRGRPRKPVDPEELNKPKLPRGRPRKPVDPDMLNKPKLPRGRPKKHTENN